MSAHSTRRDLLKGAAALASIPARSATRIIGANDRIQVANIGVGNRGYGHLRYLTARSRDGKDVEIMAVSDVYSRRRERAAKETGLDPKHLYVDYREMLARDDIDAVYIATPDHWHAQHALDAMAAGKDVYLEKPMTLTIEESREVASAAAKHKRVLQVGSQYLSDPRYHKARELIEAGEIGDLLWAQGTYSRNSTHGEWNYYVDEEGTPENIDWKRWLGPAPKRAFSPERFFRWRKYWDYSGGIATDLFYHRLGPLMYAMGAQFPERVTGSGGIYVQKDREVPDTYATTIEYPKFYITMSSSMANAAPARHFPEVIYGHKGTITFERDKVVVTPEEEVVPGAARKEYETASVTIANEHSNDFLECMRTRKTPKLGPELGYHVMAAIKLGVDSYREGKVKFFDARTERVVDRPSRRPAYEGDGKNHPGGMRKRA